MLAVKLSVRCGRHQRRRGLVAEARIPQELMNAIPAGRAAADRMTGGRVQKTAIAANAPTDTQTRPTKRAQGCGAVAARSHPRGARPIGSTMCNVRSFLRSERALQRGITSAVTRAGIATTIPPHERLQLSRASRAIEGVQVALVLRVMVRPK